MIVQGEDDIDSDPANGSPVFLVFAREWGNELFQRPEPLNLSGWRRRHDNGCANGTAADIDPKTRLPYSFMSLPTEELSSFTSGNRTDDQAIARGPACYMQHRDFMIRAPLHSGIFRKYVKSRSRTG